MKILLLVTFIFMNAITYGQSFQMQYNKISANEVQFTTIYKGPSAEIILPARGRIIALSEQNDLNAGGGKIRVGIRVGSNNETSDQEYTVRFTYSLLLSSRGGSGSISTNWYPTIKDIDTEYTVTTLGSTLGMLIYPYMSNENNTFNFMDSQNPQLLVFNHTKETSSETSLPITLYTATKFETSFDNMIKITDYINDYFGKKDIQEIIIINMPLITSSSFFSDGKLFVNIPGNGTEKQVKDTIIIAWEKTKENLSTRFFNMFKDSVFRLAPLTLNTTSVDESTPAEAVNTDLGKIVLVPGTSYYQELFNKGFETNSVQYVDIEGIFNNYALLHLAQYNIGTETLLAGIKAYFNGADPIPTTEKAAETADSTTENITNTNTIDKITTESTNNIPTKTDAEYIDWTIITQNKLQDPLFSLYTKEIFAKNFVPHLIAKGNTVSRNSFNIPNFNMTDSEGTAININWNDFRSINIDISTNSSYTIDPERQVPQQNYMDSYYTPNTNEQNIRHQIIALASRQKAVGEINIRTNLNMVKFTVESENPFQVETGSSIYVLVSHILSNVTGSLKPGIKESFFAVDIDGKVTYITTRLRI